LISAMARIFVKRSRIKRFTSIACKVYDHVSQGGCVGM
jgi:hypothetical protein